MNIYIQNFYFTYVLLSFWDLNNCLNCNKVLAAIENPKVLKQITGFDCKRLRSAIKVLNNEDFQSIFILNFFVLISLFQKFIKIYLIQRIFNIIHLLPISSTGFLLKTKISRIPHWLKIAFALLNLGNYLNLWATFFDGIGFSSDLALSFCISFFKF